MKVTNEDIEALRSVITILFEMTTFANPPLPPFSGSAGETGFHLKFSLRGCPRSDLNRTTHTKVPKLKSKLLIEFTKREFPEFKDSH